MVVDVHDYGDYVGLLEYVCKIGESVQGIRLLVELGVSEGMCLPGPLTPGRGLLFRLLVSCALSTREQMYSVFAFRCVQPFRSVLVRYLQLLMSLIATMIAMTTIRTMRTIRR